MFEITRTFLKVVPLLAIFQAVRCSVVVDSYSQKGIHVSDYCPRMEHCPEGTHVMCMYYDPNHEVGPRCANFQNVSITPTIANQILDIVNAIRSKIATGEETGRNGTRLPRGYGIFRLKWDNELATFAQVMANQCFSAIRDLCRATKRFPDPEQNMCRLSFNYPDWTTSKIKTKGMDDSKLTYGVTQGLKIWYEDKMTVTEDLILNYPTPAQLTANGGGKLYMATINGMATHMGCGFSAYTHFFFQDSKRSKNSNFFLLFCNFSSKSKPGRSVYSVSPAPGTSACGCPEGSQEDFECLCNEIAIPPRPLTFEAGTQTEIETCPNQETNCEPTLVLLPIFTIENAPPDKLVEEMDDNRNTLTSYLTGIRNASHNMYRTGNLERNDFFADAQRSFQFQQQDIPHSAQSLPPNYMWPIVRTPLQMNVPSPLSPPAPRQTKITSPGRSYVNNNNRAESLRRRVAQSPRPRKRLNPTSKKSSIFNRVAQFKLPNDRMKSDQYESIKPDVKPRKDFKNIQKVVNDYIKKRNNKFRRTEIVTNKHKDNLKRVTLRTTPKVEDNTETFLNNVEEKVISVDHFHRRNNMSEDNIKNFDLNYEESDNKLMTLLDTLEREVKHIELDGNEKEIFDAKIRKIYDTVVGKPEPLSVPKPKPRLKSVPKFKANIHPMPSELLETDFGESKTFVQHESNHITESYDDIRIRQETDHLLEDNENAYKQIDKLVNRARDNEYIDNKYSDKLDLTQMRKEDKPPEVFDTKPYYDNDILTDTDHKLFSDIEKKYNERLAAAYSRSKSDQKYQDTDDKFNNKNDVFNGHRFNNMPPSINRNSIGKYENLKPRANSEEARKLRAFDKYRGKDSISNIRVDAERNYFRNGKDDRKQRVSVGRKRGNDYLGGNEVDQNDPLSAERRKYYQEKLDTLERRLRDRSMRRNKYDDRPNERSYRRMRPNREQAERPRSKQQGDSFYMPDRARFLHGF